MRIQVQGIYEQKWYKTKKVIAIAFVAIAIALVALCVYISSKENLVVERTYAAKNNIQQESKLSEENESYLPKLTNEGQENIKHIYSSDTKIAYLTFDDGPSSDVTPLILDLLKQKEIKATFFVLGSRVKACPDIVKRAYEEGHYIANHGYSHKYSKIYKNVQAVLEEYDKTEQYIREAIGIENYSSHLFRFPGGSAGRAI